RACCMYCTSTAVSYGIRSVYLHLPLPPGEGRGEGPCRAASAWRTLTLTLSRRERGKSRVAFLLQGGLRRGQAGNGHPERGTTHVVQVGAVEEGYRARLTAVLTADTHFQVGACLAPALDPNADQFPDAFLVENYKRIVLQNTTLDIGWQEHAGIIAAQT